MIDFDNFTKLSKNVEDLSKLIVAKPLKTSPKSNKSPNLVTLVVNLKIKSRTPEYLIHKER